MRTFVKLYTPFICAIIVIIHGVLYLLKYKGLFYVLASEFTGHSLLLLYFVYIHSKRMCIWYKSSIIMLSLIHVSNLLYKIGILERASLLYIGIVLNSAALMCWLIFISTYKTTKAVRAACKHSQQE